MGFVSEALSVVGFIFGALSVVGFLCVESGDGGPAEAAGAVRDADRKCPGRSGAGRPRGSAAPFPTHSGVHALI